MELCRWAKVLEAGESHFGHSLCTDEWVSIKVPISASDENGGLNESPALRAEGSRLMPLVIDCRCFGISLSVE